MKLHWRSMVVLFTSLIENDVRKTLNFLRFGLFYWQRGAQYNYNEQEMKYEPA